MKVTFAVWLSILIESYMFYINFLVLENSLVNMILGNNVHDECEVLPRLKILKIPSGLGGMISVE